MWPCHGYCPLSGCPKKKLPSLRVWSWFRDAYFFNCLVGKGFLGISPAFPWSLFSLKRPGLGEVEPRFRIFSFWKMYCNYKKTKKTHALRGFPRMFCFAVATNKMSLSKPRISDSCDPPQDSDPQVLGLHDFVSDETWRSRANHDAFSAETWRSQRRLPQKADCFLGADMEQTVVQQP